VPEYEEQLKEISEQVNRAVVPARVAVRTFLSWFAAERRGGSIVQRIRGILQDYGLQTDPDFDQLYIDGEISFVRATDAPQVDPTYRISRLESASRKPVSVAPNAALLEAISKMMINDYSQLPVMTTERGLKGVISWKSIGSRLTLNEKLDTVQSCIDPPVVVSSNIPLLEAIDLIASKEYVLVRDKTDLIVGIVTASDLSQQFRQLAEPFLLLGEIENYIRRMLQDKFTLTELQSAKDPDDTARTVQSLDDLSVGEYLRLIENPDHWTKIKLNIDRVMFVEELKKVRNIRNDVMHFDPDPIEPKELDTLRRFAAFMQKLSSIGAI
jgi:CBS domain-containing protein